jgi:hypothetical protein
MEKKLQLYIITMLLLCFASQSYGQKLDFGSIESFLVYSARGAVSNTNTIGVNSTFQGDIGTNVGAITGFGATSAPSSSVPYGNGNLVNQNALTTQAKVDLLNIYIHLVDVPVTHPSPGRLAHGQSFGGGETLEPGVYLINGAGSLTGNIILDGGGDTSAFYIFKFNGGFTAAAFSNITLQGGARSKNIFWIAEGAITIEASSVVKGTFIAHPGAISVGYAASIEGRILSSDGAISFYAGDSKLPDDISDIPISCTDFCATIMGSAAKFVLFSSDGGDVSNGAISGFIGDIGTDGGNVTNLAGAAVVGNIYINDDTTAQAKIDLLSAYNTLIGITSPARAHAAAFGSGETLTAGVYSIGGAGSLAGTLTLDGQNDQDALFIFKFNGAFTTEAQSRVILVNGARRCNIFWVAEGVVGMGTFSHMKGNLIAHNGANSMGANGNLEGGMYSTYGAVSFDTGVIYNQYSLCNKIVIANPDIGDDVNGRTGGISFVNILNNDSLASLKVQSSEVNLSLISATPVNDDTLDLRTNIYLVGNNVVVAPGTPAGDYILTYRICEAGSPQNCAQTFVTVTVIVESIVANNDSYESKCPTNSVLGNVLTNDRINDTSFAVNDVILSLESGANSNIYLDTITGDISTNSALALGKYTLVYKICQVLNPTNCSNATLTITQKALIVTKTQTNILCYGDSTGTSTATVTGGTPSYVYSWNTTPVQTSAIATGLSVGSYVITVTDSTGCMAKDTTHITQQQELIVSAPDLLLSFYGDSTGTSTATVTGGTASYTYSWNTTPIQTSAIVTGLSVGSYVITVIDSTGCMAKDTIHITQQPELIVSAPDILLNCYGGITGTSTASVTGGTGGYTYSWNTTPIQTTATANGLSVGSYVITVTDNTGSTGKDTILITQPGLLVVSAPDVSLSNYGDNDGASFATVTGGTGVYTYSWNTNPVQTSAIATGLFAGIYVITVTDALGCMAKDTIDVTQPLPPNFTPTIDINSLVFVNAGDTRDFIVNISNITAASSNGQIVVKIVIPSAFNITWNSASGNSNVNNGTVLNNNSNWAITQSGFFITMTSKTNVIISANASSAIGFSIARKTDVPAQTSQPITVTIVDGSGSDSQNYDNTYYTVLKAE